MFIPIFFLHIHGGLLWQGMAGLALTMFFALSGFLTGYGRLDSYASNTCGELACKTRSSIKKKFRRFYPLHFICFLYCAVMLFCFPSFPGFRPAGWEDALWKAALNLSLTQDWFPPEPIKFCYNGVSWFLSALIFCYAAAPWLMRAVAWLKARFGAGAVVFAAATAICLYMFPYAFDSNLSVSDDWCSIFRHEWHGWIPFRMVEFFVGMCGGCLLPHCTGVELADCTPATRWCVQGVAAVSIAWLACHPAVPPPLLLVPVTMLFAALATTRIPWLSFLSWPVFVFLGKLVMPVYLIHNLFLKTFNFLNITPLNSYPRQILMFIASFAVGWLVMKLLELIEARCFKARQV